MESVPIEDDGAGGETGVLVEVDDLDQSICSSVDSSHIYHMENYCDGRMSLALMIAMLVLGFITILINLGVIIRTVKILKDSHTKKPSFYFIGNLAVSDFAIGLYVVIAFLLHITRKSDLWQKNTCMLQIAVAVTACQETIFTITLIAVDKYLYICHGLHYSAIVTTKRVYIAIASTWLLSLLIGTLPAMGMHLGWEESCGRCVFAQVVSPDFIIVFFITSVAVPYLVIVSLYSVLLVLALKMHKARYGGSVSGASTSRTSNFRLSFMSTKSGKSNKTTKCSTSSSCSITAYKAARKRARKLEMEAYKTTLPELGEKKEHAQLIRGTSDEGKAVDAPENVKENWKEDTQFMQGTVKDQNQEAKHGIQDTSSPPLHSDDRDGDSSNGEKTKEEHVGTNNRAYTKGERDSETGEDNKGTAVQKATENDETNKNETKMVNSDDEKENKAGWKRNEGDRQVKISISEDDATTSTTGEATEQNEQNMSCKTQTALKTKTKTPPNTTQSQEKPTLRKSHKERRLSSTTDEEGGTEEDVEPDQECHDTHSWFPSKYLNRVMTNTRDKVLFFKKCRAVKTVGLIIISFSATYVPFVVGCLVYATEKDKRMCLLHMLNTLLYCAVVANSIANPFIYAYGYSEFRLKTKKFKGIFATERARKT